MVGVFTRTECLILFISGIIIEEVFIAASVMLLKKKDEQHDRSRLIAGIFSLFCSLSNAVLVTCVGISLITGKLGILSEVFLPVPLSIAFPFYILLPGYLNEVFHPSRTTLKRALLVLVPYLIIVLSFVLCVICNGGEHTFIYSMPDIAQNIAKPDVIARILLSALYLLYGLSVFGLKIAWRTSNANKSWMRVLRCATVLIAFTFIFGMSLRVFPVFVAHLFLMTLINVLICIYEFRVRVTVPQLSGENLSGDDIHQAKFRNLAKQLKSIVDVEDVWQNPDICVNEMCSLLGTNRDYLSRAVKELGYANFSEMINSRRVEFIHDEILADPSVKLTDLFFIAGYRSRTTATRCFQQRYGCAPSELVKQ